MAADDHDLFRRYSARRGGYVMLIALVLMALLAVLGSTTLNIAGVDQRIALQNRKHMMVINTSMAGTEHARSQLGFELPASEGYDTGITGDFISATEAEADFGGTQYTHNLGVYWVDATFHRCGNPPPGYSAEAGAGGFSSTYWEMTSMARMQDTTQQNINETRAVSSAMIRKVIPGDCKIR